MCIQSILKEMYHFLAFWLGSSTGKMAKKQNLEEHAHGLSIEKNGKETAAPGAMLT